MRFFSLLFFLLLVGCTAVRDSATQTNQSTDNLNVVEVVPEPKGSHSEAKGEEGKFISMFYVDLNDDGNDEKFIFTGSDAHCKKTVCVLKVWDGVKKDKPLISIITNFMTHNKYQKLYIQSSRTGGYKDLRFVTYNDKGEITKSYRQAPLGEQGLIMDHVWKYSNETKRYNKK